MSTLRDCVYGLAIGDALGVPFESLPRDSFTCTGVCGGGMHGKPAGTFSDDTSLTLALCESIRVCGCVDCADIRMRFERWFHSGAYTADGAFGIGSATRRALECGRGQGGERDNGNGSLMRTAPLAFTDATDDEIAAVSAITHAHAISKRACVDAVHMMRELASGLRPTLAAAHIGFADVAGRARGHVRSGGYVLDTLEAAVWCLVTTDSYASCVLAAVNLGSDTDTTACVAGALAGIVYGVHAIPAAWLDTLRGRDIVERCLF